MTAPITEELVRCPRCGHEFGAYWRGSLNRDHFPELSDDDFRRYVRKCNTASCPECGRRFAIAPQLVVQRTDETEVWHFS